MKIRPVGAELFHTFCPNRTESMESTDIK